MSYKQLIIVRRDLQMSPGKLAAQVSHASMAFLTNSIKENAKLKVNGCGFGASKKYIATLYFDQDVFEEWIDGSFTKVVCGARNKGRLEKAIKKAEELGMIEGEDFFLIRDNCMTELEPEDEDGRTLTCIGFRPMEASEIDKIGKEFNLY